jgi:HTH-type transcriptional regulator/antitoxin HipB
MLIRTPSDLGAIIRDRRLRLGLDQLSLARKAGTSRKWLVEVEKGKPRAEIGLILRTLGALDIELAVNPSPGARHRRRTGEGIKIDSILDSLKRRQ